MTHNQRNRKQNIIAKVVDLVLDLPWLDVFTDLWQLVHKLLAQHPRGPFEVLEYESTLELLDPEGKRAVFHKREKVRYLQDNIIAYQDQAWGDGEILVNYRCTPGKPVDCYRLGHKWHMLISRQQVKNRGDIDIFNIEWEIRNGFLKATGYWETHVIHPTERLKVNVVFPQSRTSSQMMLIESNRMHTSSVEGETLLPDGRRVVSWGSSRPRLHENYTLQWLW